MRMTSALDINESVWVGLVRAHQAVLASIETSLKEANFPPLSWYDVLLELERAGADGTQAFVLGEKLLLPQYGLCRLLERIEKAGYLKRTRCDKDGRAQVLLITKAGVEIRQQIWEVYSAAIQRSIGQKLSLTDAETLAKILVQLK